MAAETLREEVRVWVSRFACFYPRKKEPGTFPLACFPLATEAETALQTEENHALNTGTGDGDGKGVLDRSVHFPDKADLSSAFPVASSARCISLCFCCLGFFFKVE